jgi:hypothetical protein
MSILPPAVRATRKGFSFAYRAIEMDLAQVKKERQSE